MEPSAHASNGKAMERCAAGQSMGHGSKQKRTLPFQASKFSLCLTDHLVAPERDRSKRVSKHRQPRETTRQLAWVKEVGGSSKDRRAEEELPAPEEQEVLLINEGVN